MRAYATLAHTISPQKYCFFCIYANKKCKFRQKPALFFSLVCYSRLLSVGRLVLLRSVYLHAEGNKRALAHYTATGNKRRQAIHAL